MVLFIDLVLIKPQVSSERMSDYRAFIVIRGSVVLGFEGSALLLTTLLLLYVIVCGPARVIETRFTDISFSIS